MITDLTNISHPVSDLIFYFKYGNQKEITNIEIVEKIKSFNHYEYLYFLNEVLPHIEKKLKTFKLLFSFQYDDYSGLLNSSEAEKSGTIEFINLIKHFNLNEINENYLNQNILERLTSLFYWKNTLNFKILELENQIIQNLKLLKLTNDITIISKEIDEIINYNDHHSKEISQDISYKESEKSVFDKIIDGIYFQRVYFSDFDYEMNDSIKKECLRIKNLCDLGKPKHHIISILIYGLKYWKKNIANNLLIKEESFEDKKQFYLESINEFERRTNQNYIKQLIYEQEEIKNKNNIIEICSPAPVSLVTLKNWITNTFKSYNKIKDLDLISLVDELPIKNKIIISSQFSQSQFLNILNHFFKKTNTQLSNSNLNALKGFISNFIDFSNQSHYKKYIEKTPYFIIDFIPQKYYKDFIKIFLILHNPKNGIITSNITTIREVLTALFYNKENKRGLSYESIRRITNLKFSKDLKSFESYFKYILENLNRDYYLPQ